MAALDDLLGRKQQRIEQLYRLELGRTALLVIDMQRAFLEPGAALEAPRSDELVVRGHTYDKFLGTPLDLALRSWDVRCLIVTGILTDICVNCTLLSAANRDYRVTAVTDSVATLWPELQEACFTVWRRKFARLRTAAEVVDELGGVAGTC
jgi:nicotinamidase-related amidase